VASAAIAIPRPSLGELLKLVGLPSKASESERSAEMSDRANELVRTVVTVVDDLVSGTIEQRTANDFVKVRAEVFPQYFAAMRALGDLSRIVLTKQTIVRLSAEWFSELESDFKHLGPSAFGTDLTERGIFTVWMLRKIHDLAQEIIAAPLPPEADKDSGMAQDAATRAMWTRFHIDCLTKAMRDKKPIYPGVVDQIRDGLRQAVDTYACIRLWADLRSPQPDPVLAPLEWTADDELLLVDSMNDLERDSA
jgi:hypothetical protein